MSLSKYRAKHDDDKDRAKKAGAATLAGKTAWDVSRETLRDIEEGKMAKSRSYKDFLSKLEPGDVMFTRYKGKESPNIELAGLGEVPLRASETVQLGSGSPHYHGVLYGGKGKVYQAQGQDTTYGPNMMKKDIMGQDVKVYRPGASDAEKARALAFAEKATGTPYTSAGATLKQGLGNILGMSPSSKGCKIGPSGQINCTTSIAGAYPKQFDKLYMTPDEMRAVPGMKLVARYGHIPDLSLREKALTRLIHPTLRNLKYGAGAALGTYLLSKALNGENENVS